MKRIVAVIGHPIGHTMSPVMHNAAFEALGIDAEYLAFDVLPERLGEAIEGARALGFVGLNITIPHKVAALQYCEPDPLAASIGAVNTLVLGGRIMGYNTDATGAMESLRRAKVRVGGKEVLIMGAGGAARAIAHALVHEGAKVVVANRTKQRAVELCEALEGATAAGLDELPALVQSCDVLINATSVGMRGESLVRREWLHEGQVVFDIVYNPPETPLLKAARGAGAKTIDGVAMLVHQGAKAFELWFGVEPPVDVMERAVRRVLAEG
ncbi:MAG: shikimate dehydrogenase [Methermicoccaceae archaeon]